MQKMGRKATTAVAVAVAIRLKRRGSLLCNRRHRKRQQRKAEPRQQRVMKRVAMAAACPICWSIFISICGTTRLRCSATDRCENRRRVCLRRHLISG
jgi:hypothetical protein